MNFVKLHNGLRKIVVNLDRVTEIRDREYKVGSSIYFSDDSRIDVDETIDEILEMAEEDVQYENDAVV